MTETLFDIAPDEPQRKRSARPAATDAPQVAPAPLPRRPSAAIKPIGEIEGEPCTCKAFGEVCNTTLWDIFYEDKGDWLVGCWACGAVKWTPVVMGHLPDRSTFIVRGGRFDGMTFDQIAQEPRGLDTIKLYAGDVKRQSLCTEAKKWLDANPGRG
jgi:hypothetical protein